MVVHFNPDADRDTCSQHHEVAFDSRLFKPCSVTQGNLADAEDHRNEQTVRQTCSQIEPPGNVGSAGLDPTDARPP